MPRVVALEEGLEDIGEFLRSRGYLTVPWSEQGPMVDAVVYTEKKFGDIYTQVDNELTSVLTDEEVEARPYGVLLVNAKDKTSEEVYEIIKNRAYEGLF